MRYGLLLIVLFPLLAWSDNIYQTIDNHGIAHFSDTASPGAKIVDLSESSIYSSHDEETQADNLPEQNAAAGVNKPATPEASDAASGNYTTFAIVQPQDQATIFNNTGAVDFTIAATPLIRATDQVVVFLDGQQMPSTREGMQVRIENVDRGSHTVQLKIQDKNGQVLISSNTITINMRRPSLNNNPNIKGANVSASALSVPNQAQSLSSGTQSRGLTTSSVSLSSPSQALRNT